MAKVERRIGRNVAKMDPVSEAIEEAAKDILHEAQRLAAEHNLTGRYRRSLKARRSGYSGVSDWVVYSTDPAAVAIEYGAGPHMIGERKHPGMEGLRILNRAAGVVDGAT